MWGAAANILHKESGTVDTKRSPSFVQQPLIARKLGVTRITYNINADRGHAVRMLTGMRTDPDHTQWWNFLLGGLNFTIRCSWTRTSGEKWTGIYVNGTVCSKICVIKCRQTRSIKRARRHTLQLIQGTGLKFSLKSDEHKFAGNLMTHTLF